MGTPATPRQAMATLEEIGGVELRSRMVGVSLDSLRRRLQNALAARNSGDNEGVRAAAHALKSSAAIVGARRLHDLATRVETGPTEEAASLLDDMTAELAQVERVLEEYAQ